MEARNRSPASVCYIDLELSQSQTWRVSRGSTRFVARTSLRRIFFDVSLSMISGLLYYFMSFSTVLENISDINVACGRRRPGCLIFAQFS
eukprot:4699715-Pyramimonas_sp.AAC.1